MKGHLVGRMKTWQQPELQGLALFSYQRDPQPARLNLDFVWKSVSEQRFRVQEQARWALNFLSQPPLSVYKLTSTLLTLKPIRLWMKVGKITWTIVLLLYN